MSQAMLTATRGEFLVGVGAVFALGVEDGECVGQRVAFEVVVGDDDVDAVLVGKVHHVVGLDAAVEGDEQVDAVLLAELDAFLGDAVAFGVAVGNVVFDVLVGVGTTDFAQEGIDECHGGGAVHIVVAIDHDFLIVDDGFGESVHGFVHVLHQEGVVKLLDIGLKKVARLLHGGDAALRQERGQRTLKMQMFT